MSKPRFEIFVGGKKQFYFRLMAPNNEIILRSEGYTTKASCKKGIQSIKKNAGKDARYLRQTSRDGQQFFNLIAANHRIIGTSERYKSKSGMENGIESVKTNARSAKVNDTTV